MKKPLPPVQEQDFKSITPQGLRWLDNVRDYTYDIRIIVAEVTPTSMNANEITNITATVPGVKVGDVVLEIIQTTINTSFLIANGAVTAADTVTIQYHRGSGGGASYTPPTEDYTFVILKNTKN